MTSTAAGADAVAEQLYVCVKRLKRLVDEKVGPLGLSAARARLLAALDSDGASHQSELAARFGLAARTVTELVDGLERDGLVRREADPADRRAHQVHVTPAGRDAVLRAIAARDEVIMQVFGALDSAQLEALGGILRDVADRAQELSISTHAVQPTTT